jgi:hypothetical protein
MTLAALLAGTPVVATACELFCSHPATRVEVAAPGDDHHQHHHVDGESIADSDRSQAAPVSALRAADCCSAQPEIAPAIAGARPKPADTTPSDSPAHASAMRSGVVTAGKRTRWRSHPPDASPRPASVALRI